jgi:hypothetical protein
VVTTGLSLAAADDCDSGNILKITTEDRDECTNTGLLAEEDYVRMRVVPDVLWWKSWVVLGNVAVEQRS